MKKGWEIKALSDVCEIKTGKWDANHAVVEGKYRFYTCAKEYSFCDTKRFYGECLILPGNGVNVGEVYYYDGEFDAYQRTYVLSNMKALVKFIYYHMLLYWQRNNLTKQFGSATNFIKMGNFSEYEIPLPPLPEQKHIVAVLDEAFSALSAARDNAEKNLQNSRELLESYLNNIFANPGKDWEEKKLGEVLQKTETVNPTLKPNDIFQYIDVSSVNNRTFSIEKTICLRGDEAPSRARKMIRENDVIFATVRPTLKRIAVVTKKYDKHICSTGYFVLRGKQCIMNRCLFYYLQTKEFNMHMEKLQKGANYPAVTDNEIRKQLIVFPKSLPEQKCIVAKLDALSAETKKLGVIYQKKLADIEELKKSILHKAFNGELKGAAV